MTEDRTTHDSTVEVDGTTSDDHDPTADGGREAPTAPDGPDGPGGPGRTRGSNRSGRSLPGDFARYVNYLLLAGLVVLALVAGAQLYGAVSRTIDQWVVREYRSLFHAAFNLAVLLVAFAGISWQLRRVRE